MNSRITFFSKIRNSRAKRIVCAFLLINLIAEILSPSVSMALTSGPSAPEFSSFEPVATTDMVNDFSGDFTYNIPVLNVPGPDGAGYSMSLAYHSGSSSEEEASWVGFGWTLNPGAINRGKRGFADEFNGVDVKKYNKQKPNWTQSAKFDMNLEYNSTDDKPKDNSSAEAGSKIMTKLNLGSISHSGQSHQGEPADVSVSLSHTIRYNNYSGFSIANGFGVSAMGMASLSMNRSGGQNTFGFSVNPMAVMKKIAAFKKKKAKEAARKALNDPDKAAEAKALDKKNTDAAVKAYEAKKFHNRLRPSYTYALHSNEAPALLYSVGKHSGASWKFSCSIQLNPGNFPVGFQAGVAGDMNIQAQEGEQTKPAYGYMYSGISNTGNDDAYHDYQLEKESVFNKQDNNLGIPFNNADIFSASGNSVIGGFKLYHDSIGCFYPDKSESVTKIRQLGVEIGIGLTFQLGFDIGVGKQKTDVTGLWPKYYETKKFPANSYTSPPQMRFQGDMGGEVRYSDDYSDIVFAKVDQYKYLNQNNHHLKLDKRFSNTSSYIKYFQTGTVNTANLNPAINGLEITAKDGSKSAYMLPVFTKNETELTIGLEDNDDGAYMVSHVLDYDSPMNHKSAVGQKIAEKYATTYLLTENKTFNYVDADGDNAVSDGDFGGWTKFDYRQAYGGSSRWYRYRSPYAGLNYNGGRMLEDDDQTGSMSSGDKEVYYLKCIQTKTHIAFFVTNKTTPADYSFSFLSNAPASFSAAVTGSGVKRNDGLDADSIISGKDKAAESLNAKGVNALEKLEKIVLYAKSDLSKPLTTTYFDYDYSLCQGIPNSLAALSTTATAKERGKLTLKKVWTESGGVNNSKISPYQFQYEYFHQYPSNITGKYQWALDCNTNYTSNDPNQNPQYKPEQLDMWGNFQENGADRFKKMQPWLSQRPASSTFDPAAWQLKRIQLPSGGEIHVHYEQKDYTKVQDQSPMAMVSLLPDNVVDGYDSDNSTFCINTADLGITSLSDKLQYVNALTGHFIAQKNKLYFKVLYTFNADDDPDINTKSIKYDYVTGYVSVNKVEIGTDDKVYLHLGDTRVGGDAKKDKTLPRYVCYQELLTNGGKNLGANSGAYVNDDDLYTGIAYSSNTLQEQDFVDMSRQHVLSNTLDMFKDWIGDKVKNTTRADACKHINFPLSYFKIPTYYAKKGGGIRVKRLITYDPGISGEATGDAMVYGTEYSYKKEDGSSSGVSTNEPSTGREESALVGYLERKKQKWLSKITNGRDTKQFEGPLGESILPSASVSYGRIVMNNIHSGKTTTGYAVNTYYTCESYPFDVDFSPLSKKDETYRKLDLSIPLGLFNMDVHRAWVTQGYLFKENDMNGKLFSKSTYAGDYDPATFKDVGFTSKTTYKYSQPGDSVPTLVYDRNADVFKRAMLSPGVEEDYTLFSSNVHEKSNDFSLELDLDLSFYPLILNIGFGLSYSLSDQLFCQHVTSKVISQKTYLLSTTNVTDGVTQTTENLAFDKYTGDPVLTRTFDGFMAPYEKIITAADDPGLHNGYYYSFNIPASWMYGHMGPKSINAANTNQLSAVAGNVVTYGTNEMYTSILTSNIYINSLPSFSATTNVWDPVATPLTNVISASATQYTQNWFTDPDVISEFPAIATASVAAILDSFYYPLRTYAYKDNVKSANAGGKIYSGGAIDPANPFKFFKWHRLQQASPPAVAAEWYSDGVITRYSPYGYPVEEQDVLGIKSSAKFGYGNTLPISSVNNAGYNETKFIDFEYGFVSGTTPDPNINAQYAHSGRASYDISLNPAYNFVTNYSVSAQMINQKGLGIKLWLKSSMSQTPGTPDYGLKNPTPHLKAVIGTKLYDFKMIAQTGEWSLYSAEIRNFNGLTPGNYNINLAYYRASNSELVLIDDFRIQPLDASMNCSVYTPDNKIAAQFDDQHFGVFYEYNTKGQLVRKSIETERGKKTLQEQQYNTPLINKN